MTENTPKKIMILGLNNAGKTAILHILKNNMNVKTFRTLKPTKGINREKYEIEGIECVVWDMGGQEDYRKQYLSNPEKNFSNTELILFVIDVQDEENFNLALKYFEQIIDSFIQLNVNPYFLVLLHKVDPDVKHEDGIKKSIKLLTQKFSEIFAKTSFGYEISKSSIFSKMSTNPAIIKDIRELLSTDEELTQSKFEDQYGKTLETLMDVTIKLCTSVEVRFLEIENSIEDLKQWMKFIKEVVDLPKKPKKTKEKQDDIIQPLTNVKKSLTEELKMILNLKAS